MTARIEWMMYVISVTDDNPDPLKIKESMGLIYLLFYIEKILAIS